MLKYRILTALVLIPIILLCLFFLSPPWFCLFVSIVTIAAAWEWTHLMELKKITWRLFYLGLMATSLMSALFIPFDLIFIGASIWWIVAAILIIFYPRTNRLTKPILSRGVMGFLILVPCWTAINFIRNSNNGQGVYALLFLFALIWGADSAAYFVGKKWGKHKLAPLVSPGKSWEGFAGAMLSTVIIALIVLWLCDIPFSIWPYAVVLSLITVLFSIVGDLFESMIKREANLKDSGNLLPGHGGLLDRIDSLTAAAPVFTMCAIFLSDYLN